MKAILHTKYGSTSNLKLAEVEKPVPKPNEVLVKIVATSVNSWDWDWVIGRPYIYRLLFGLFKPRYKIIGCDIAGIIEEVGSEITHLKVGDAVFGDLSISNWGGFAEYVCASGEALAIKPEALSFVDAAALPQAGLLALQGLEYNGKIKPGQKVLINGAGGGVGTLGLQMAKHWGAEVTCVDAGEKLKFLKDLGADHVIDYTKEDYTNSNQQYDLVIDVTARHAIKDYNKVIKKGGAFGIIGGSVSTFLSALTIGTWLGKKEGKKLGIVAHKPNVPELNQVAEMVVSGIIKPVIDKEYPLHETPAAIQSIGDAKAIGKVIILM